MLFGIIPKLVLMFKADTTIVPCLIFYSDKLAHTQVIINSIARDAPICTSEDGLTYILGMPYFDEVVSYNLLTTQIMA